MVNFSEIPECQLCHSQELEIVINVEVGLVVLCDECGYSKNLNIQHRHYPFIETVAS